ncbi:MAG: ChaN family lipoprotein [Myxococcota bacterium]|nr:ChaN family lipoprotein [Myxococcota bacterium]
MGTRKKDERPSKTARRAVSEMIELQRRIFERQRKTIEASEAHPSRGFARYKNEYRKSVKGYVSESGFGALCDAIARSRIAYVADYHTLAIAQRTFVKLITGIMYQVDNLVLAMEFVPSIYQAELDRYLKRKIKEKTFLKRIRYRENWPYDIWPNFRPVFELAADHGFPMIAIDSDASAPLSVRDRQAAARIAEVAKRFPDAIILVYTGQMHVAPSHLPSAVERAFISADMPTPRRVIVYQNAEEIYWQLAQARREHVEVVKVNEESFCVNNTPPLVQQLSYLHWIHYDQHLLEYTELESTVRSLIRNLGRFYNLPYKKAVESVRVLMPGDLDLMAFLEEANISLLDRRQILAAVEAEESACIPKMNAIYLATLSINHAAEEAAHYLRYSVSPGDPPEAFRDRLYFYVLNEAVAFFSSKVINPKRKTDHQGKLRQIDAEARKRGGKPRPDERAAAFALDHLMLERGSRLRKRKLRSISSPIVFNAAAHMLGYMLGDRLYYGMTSGVIGKKTIRDLFLTPLNRPNEALDIYFSLSDMVRSVRIPSRI